MGPVQNVDYDSLFNNDHGNFRPVVENDKNEVILFIWKDSYLCLSEHYVQEFKKGATSPLIDKEDEEAALLEKPYVFWNNGQGICKLVSLSNLKAAFSACRPLRVYSIQLPFTIFDEIFQEIFGDQTADSKQSYYVVGGLDSNSQGSNFLQWRIKEAYKQAQLAPQQQARQLPQAQLAQQQAQQQAQQLQQQAQLAQQQAQQQQAQQAQQLEQPEQSASPRRKTLKRKAAADAGKKITEQLKEESKLKRRKIKKLSREIETNNHEQVKEYQKQQKQLDLIEESNDVASLILKEKKSNE
jgi:hypothetical protein